LKTALTNLIHELVKHGFIRAAMDVSEILSELMADDYTENQDSNDEEAPADPSSIVNIVGLRGDTKPEEPMGGMTVNPFFFDPGDPF
jgi:hypothetical protein